MSRESVRNVRVRVTGGSGDYHPPAPAARPYKPEPPVPASVARRRAGARRAFTTAAAAIADLRDGDLTPGLADQLGDVIAAAEDQIGRQER